jgi:hypothetical protein
MLDEPERTATYTDRGQQMVAERFTLTSMVGQYEALYESLLRLGAATHLVTEDAEASLAFARDV